MKVQLTQEEKQATRDAIAGFKEKDPKLEKEYEIEFVIANFDEARTLKLFEFLKANDINYQRFEQKESDAFVFITMRLDDERIIEIESYLTYFANDYGFKYDGWGAFE
jgi:hypothetical protein